MDNELQVNAIYHELKSGSCILENLISKIQPTHGIQSPFMLCRSPLPYCLKLRIHHELVLEDELMEVSNLGLQCLQNCLAGLGAALVS